MEAEEILAKKIRDAFESIKPLSSEDIESNPYFLEEVPSEEFKSYLPSFMIHTLFTYRTDPQSLIYIQLIFHLNELSKDRAQKAGFSAAQLKAISAFLQHLLHNQPSNIDEQEIHTIIKRM